jgi:hypothetical protein
MVCGQAILSVQANPGNPWFNGTPSRHLASKSVGKARALASNSRSTAEIVVADREELVENEVYLFIP